MKVTTKLFLILILFAALAFPGVALAQDSSGDKYVFGGSYTLESGDSLNGNLYVMGGIAIIEDGASLNGDAILLGGTLRVEGTVNGDIAATGGLVNLENSARVHGDINIVAAHIDREPGSEVDGSINTNASQPFDVRVPGGARVPTMNVNFNPFFDMLWFFFRSFLWAALAVLAVLFLPRHVERVSNVALTQPLVSGGLGILTVVVLPILLVVVAITIIGIPVALLGILLLVVCWAFGMIAVGIEVGRRLAELFHQEWAPAVLAGLGTFALTLVVNGLNAAIPCIGWMPSVLVGAIGLGAVLLTRFGTQDYPPYAPLAPTPPPPPAPPVEPL